ncbi:MAG TPA: thioredoxin domain-containing protein, partial [Tepidisphaeraceae bacterium]|nr:thioredoxin domain-containing protein [Tepidisphaeraceae bacterium]
MSDSKRHTNRLSLETSPYLLQHQHNPVDWFSWSEQAFERARSESKPIFLSVGYSSCYWCHVMERESFENENVAQVMNKHFVNIKLDREERPDVDQLYMTAVQLLTSQGGWPMSVWLTPDLRPFYAGTYFPPDDRYGRPGFSRLCEAIGESWRDRRDQVEEQATKLTEALKQLATPANRADESASFDLSQLIDQSVHDFDVRNGGFGHAPKFPRQTLLTIILNCLASDRSEVSSK